MEILIYLQIIGWIVFALLCARALARWVTILKEKVEKETASPAAVVDTTGGNVPRVEMSAIDRIREEFDAMMMRKGK